MFVLSSFYYENGLPYCRCCLLDQASRFVWFFLACFECSFFSHFPPVVLIHDCSSNMNISFINAKMGVVKVWSIYFLQQSPPLATVLGRHRWFRCLKLWHWNCLQMAWLLHCTVSLCVIQIFVLFPIRVIIFLCYRFLELYYRFAVLKP